MHSIPTDMIYSVQQICLETNFFFFCLVKCLTRSLELKETIRNARGMVGYYENLSLYAWEVLKKTAKWKAEGHALCKRRITDILKFTDLLF